MLPNESADREPRVRLLSAARTLFGRVGYELTTTSAIARDARTSESQLMRHFGSKAGLLEALFNEAWRPLNERVERVVATVHDPHAALIEIFTVMSAAFRRDPEIAALFLLEGRRLRGTDREVRLARGFTEFLDLLRRVVRRGQQQHLLRTDLDAGVAVSALTGAAEGLIRDWLLATHTRGQPTIPARALQQTFAALVGGLQVRTDPSHATQRRRLGA
jgi:AcrR family transcriptional regulator